MFGISFFVTFYLQGALGYSPVQTGFSFLPMIGMLIVAAQVETNLLLPRFGPRVMVTSGMILGVIAMIYLTISSATSTYLDILLILGFGMGLIMPASMQTATLGVEPQFAGVAPR